MKNINSKIKPWINLIVFFITLGINSLGSLGLINGMSQKAVSDKYHTLITPSPITFSIWGLIYTLLLISLIMMIIKEKDIAYKRVIDIFTPIFLISCIFNILWIISFSYEKIGASTLFIFGLFISLTSINKKLSQHKREIPNKLLNSTFGLYAGWLMIATVVNIAAFLVSVSWRGLGISPIILAPIILVISLILVILINKNLKNAVFPLPVGWAYFGILMESKRLGDHIDYGPYMKPVIVIGIVVLLCLSIIQFKRNNYCVIKKGE